MTQTDDPKAFEWAYKLNIVDLLSKALYPGWFDPAEKFSDQARAILQSKAREKAIEGLRSISKFIKEPF